MATRRWFYFIPSKGEPRKLVHRIEAGMLDRLAGHEAGLFRVGGAAQVAAQVAFRRDENRHAVFAGKQHSLHRAGRCRHRRAGPQAEEESGHIGGLGAEIRSGVDARAASLASRSRPRSSTASRGRPSNAPPASCTTAKPLTEFELQQWILEQFRANGLTTSEPPDRRRAAEQRQPTLRAEAARFAPIRAGDLLLLDIWAKLDRPGSVYYDITWTGYMGAARARRLREDFPHRAPGARRAPSNS